MFEQLFYTCVCNAVVRVGTDGRSLSHGFSSPFSSMPLLGHQSCFVSFVADSEGILKAKLSPPIGLPLLCINDFSMVNDQCFINMGSSQSNERRRPSVSIETALVREDCCPSIQKSFHLHHRNMRFKSSVRFFRSPHCHN